LSIRSNSGELIQELAFAADGSVAFHLDCEPVDIE
jgi:hypothetical protein